MTQASEKTSVGRRLTCAHCGASFIVIKVGNVPTCGGTKLCPA
jgi:NinF protein